MDRLESERIDSKAPWQIREWMMHPYRYFGSRLQSLNSVLDIGCGNNLQQEIKEEFFTDIKNVDKHVDSPDVDKKDFFKISDAYDSDVAFMFEVIEHLPSPLHERAITKLVNHAKFVAVVGSVALDGILYLDSHRIWKGDLNTYHLHEYEKDDWVERFATRNEGWELMKSIYLDGQFLMVNWSEPTPALSYYAYLDKRYR